MRKFLSLLLAVSSATVLSAQINTELIGELSYPDNMSNVWGWTAPGGEEYVIAGTFDGTSIVDITDPSTPVEIQLSTAPTVHGAKWVFGVITPTW